MTDDEYLDDVDGLHSDDGQEHSGEELSMRTPWRSGSVSPKSPPLIIQSDPERARREAEQKIKEEEKRREEERRPGRGDQNGKRESEAKEAALINIDHFYGSTSWSDWP